MMSKGNHLEKWSRVIFSQIESVWDVPWEFPWGVPLEFPWDVRKEFPWDVLWEFP